MRFTTSTIVFKPVTLDYLHSVQTLDDSIIFAYVTTLYQLNNMCSFV